MGAVTTAAPTQDRRDTDMFKTETCVTITCDHCGAGLEYDDHIPHFNTEADALEAAREYDWIRTRDGKVYCEGYELPACTCPNEEACGDGCPIGCPCVLHDEIKAPGQPMLFPAAAEGTDWASLGPCPNCGVGAGGVCVQKRQARTRPHLDHSLLRRFTDKAGDEWQELSGLFVLATWKGMTVEADEDSPRYSLEELEREFGPLVEVMPQPTAEAV